MGLSLGSWPIDMEDMSLVSDFLEVSQGMIPDMPSVSQAFFAFRFSAPSGWHAPPAGSLAWGLCMGPRGGAVPVLPLPWVVPDASCCVAHGHFSGGGSYLGEEKDNSTGAVEMYGEQLTPVNLQVLGQLGSAVAAQDRCRSLGSGRWDVSPWLSSAGPATGTSFQHLAPAQW
ncbi:UNVERIFIED_CONTAM: hypothetical protein K2H54_040857 [Gekko kuhli]